MGKVSDFQIVHETTMNIREMRILLFDIQSTFLLMISTMMYWSDPLPISVSGGVLAVTCDDGMIFELPVR